MREITAATSTPICAGENLYLRHGFRELIENQAVDIIMPDIPKCGGLSDYWSTITADKRDIIRDGFIEISNAPRHRPRTRRGSGEGPPVCRYHLVRIVTRRERLSGGGSISEPVSTATAC